MSIDSWRARLAQISDLSEAQTLLEELVAENERLRAALETARSAQTTRSAPSSAPCTVGFADCVCHP